MHLAEMYARKPLPKASGFRAMADRGTRALKHVPHNLFYYILATRR